NIFTRIIGTGSYLPPKIVKNSHFLNNKFYDAATRQPFDKSNEEIISKFKDITHIEERRYVKEGQVTSDLAVHAVKDACESAEIDMESWDFLIVAHNFGDMAAVNVRSDILPGLAKKVKAKLMIKNPQAICYVVISGCTGWTQAMIVAAAFVKSGYGIQGVVV